MRAIENPRQFGLNEEDRKKLLGKANETFNLIGECFLRADRLQEATAAFQKANAEAPNAGLLEYNLARVAARSGKPAEALARLEKVLSLRLPNEGTDPYELLAEVLKKLGREKELTERLEKLQTADPDNADLAYVLAGQYGRAGKVDQAETLYLAALKKAPTVAGYAGLMQLCRKGKRADTLLAVLGDVVEKEGVLESLETEEKAIVGDAVLVGDLVRAARQRLASSPKKLSYGMRKAVAMLSIEGKQYATAAEFFDLAIAARPDQASDLLLLWGMGLLMDDRAAEAAKVFQRGIDLKPPAEDEPALLSYLAAALAMSDRTDRALAAARKAAELRKDSPWFCNRVPWVLLRAKRYDEATAAYTALVARFDAGSEAKMQDILRDAQSALDRRDWKALGAAFLAGATTEDDHSTETREILREARLELSGLCVLKHRLPEAEEWLQQVLDEYPDDVAACNDLGYLWADQGTHLERALKMIRHAVAAEPDNAAYRDSLGWVLYRLGRYPAAVVELEKAAAKEPAAEVLDHLGDARLKTGQVEKANRAWRLAAEAFRKDKEEDKARQVEKKITGKR